MRHHRRILSILSLYMACCAIGFPGAGQAAGADDRLPAVEILDEIHSAPEQNAVRTDYLGYLFLRAGAAPGDFSFQPVVIGGEEHRNLLLRLEGTERKDDFILIGAHTDSTEDSRGVIDDWSGCVMLAALYRELKDLPRRHTFIFVGFACEEAGLLGSQVFLDRFDRRERSRIRAMVNLECLGVGDLRTWVNASADSLEAPFHETAAVCGVPTVRQVLFGYVADSAAFNRTGIPAITIHSLSGPMLSVINSPEDDGRYISPARLRDALRVLKAYLLRLDAGSGRLCPKDGEAGFEPARTAMKPFRSASSFGGVPVSAFAEGSPEFRAGLRSGDVLTAVDGHALARPAELGTTILTLHRGQKVKMLVARGGADAERSLIESCYRTEFPVERYAEAGSTSGAALVSVLPPQTPFRLQVVTVAY